jgi:hypothetical protein
VVYALFSDWGFLLKENEYYNQIGRIQRFKNILWLCQLIRHWYFIFLYVSEKAIANKNYCFSHIYTCNIEFLHFQALFSPRPTCLIKQLQVKSNSVWSSVVFFSDLNWRWLMLWINSEIVTHFSFSKSPMCLANHHLIERSS